ncbi:MAG: hypothetical protein LBB65_01865, partial [Burkholderiales bacterium]|nr:hypothetical protein [Burkholderiales bacterium]
AAQQNTLRRTLRALIAADNNISLLEVVIALLVDQHLREMASPAGTQISGSSLLADCAADMALLQSIVTHNTQQTPAQVVLDAIDTNGKIVNETTTATAHAVEQALNRLNRLTIDEKKKMFQTLYDACGRPSPAQQEILSLLAACLHTPPLEAMMRYPGSDLTLV